LCFHNFAFQVFNRGFIAAVADRRIFQTNSRCGLLPGSRYAVSPLKLVAFSFRLWRGRRLAVAAGGREGVEPVGVGENAVSKV
jgi:hypothetical protein